MSKNSIIINTTLIYSFLIRVHLVPAFMRAQIKIQANFTKYLFGKPSRNKLVEKLSLKKHRNLKLSIVTLTCIGPISNTYSLQTDTWL